MECYQHIQNAMDKETPDDDNGQVIKPAKQGEHMAKYLETQQWHMRTGCGMEYRPKLFETELPMADNGISITELTATMKK